MSQAIAGIALPSAYAALALGAAGAVALAAHFFGAAGRRRQVALRAAQDALRESEERLRHALEATSEIVWDYDVVAETIFHPRWAQVYGYAPEVTPRTMEEVARYVHPDDVAALVDQTREAIAGERRSIEVEHRVRAASGEWRWMLGKARVVARDERGKALRIVGTCADVTERKKMLSRLQFAERMASVGTLAAGVAHEINNPLAYLTGNIGYVLEALRDAADRLASGRGDAAALGRVLEESHHALSEAQEGAQRVRRIVRDLKDFSRLDDERKAPVDLRRVVERALNLAESEIRQRARLAVRLAKVPAVVGDESRLSQVFLNLLVNAAQAIPEGHAEKNRIEVEVRPGSRASVIVEVRDTGCGVAPEHLQRIFDPFFTTKPVGIGTGLGLAICHGIVSALGGEIEVESKPGAGSTFRVTLPSAAASAVPAEAPQPAPPPSRRGRVLVVDDEPLFCKTVERVLASQHDVVACSDPRQALARIEAGERFDVVLSDLIMPRMTGMELHDAIARIAPEVAERMLFVTGGAFTPNALGFVSTRADRVLEKPLAPEALRAAVSAALDRAAVAGVAKTG